MGKMVRATLRGLLWNVIRGLRPRIALLLAAWLVCAYHTGNPGKPIVPTVQSLFNKANTLLHLPNPTDVTDSLALAGFQQIIDLAAQPGLVPDSLLFHAFVNKGILLEIQTNYTTALKAYLRAQGIRHRNPRWSDSLSYEVAERAGASYYYLNNFDSASYFLQKAETLLQRFPGIPEKERLYNDLGCLYYENGNYLQGRNYLTQALEILNKKASRDLSWINIIRINIAKGCYKMGQYRQAIAIYQTLSAQKTYPSLTYLNMGLAYKDLGSYPEALACFHKVNTRELPGVYNELGHTHLLLHRTDSADYYLKRFQAVHTSATLWGNMYTGMNYLYRGDLLQEQQQYETALQAYQRAIVIFSDHFTDTSTSANPSRFTGTFASYRLFDALFKKAATFETLYHVYNGAGYLQSALATYTSAIALLRYIEKSYDTDDAKLFLKNNNQRVFQQAVNVCLQLHALHPDAGYAQQAFVIAERNKASVMYSGLKEKGFRKLTGIAPALLQQERNIKYNLARLSIREDQTQDSTLLSTYEKDKATFEVQLAQVQNAIEQNSTYYKLKYSESYPTPDSIRPYLSSQQAVISFYATGNHLQMFVVTKEGFQHTSIDSFAAIQQAATQWLTALQTPENGRRFQGAPWGSQLYRQLIKPVQALTGHKTEWIIIPDNILYYLPFESLPASETANAEPLLATNEISYQFSARFIVAQATAPPASEKEVPTLAFAPFAHTGKPFPHHEYNFMQQLPASAQEIAQLPGRSFTDSQATKQHFLDNFSQYPVVHLATHAIADTGNSAASFIAFYPRQQTPDSAALYLEELYGLNMETTKLLIISACETGHGQLVNSEGVLSLTRGFAYAGCASIVNSLWKADDEATAAILHQFHSYLQQGYTKSKALRQAKLDYLHSNALHKTPAYWAHLIITGNTQPLVKANTGNRWLLVTTGVVAALLAGMYFIRRKKKSTWLS